MRLVFDCPLGWQIGLPLALGVIGLAVLTHRRRGLARGPTAVLAMLRAVALLGLVFLAAKPTWLLPDPPGPATRTVLLLLDRSESMSVEEGGHTRYRQALDFARNDLLPAMNSAGLPVQAVLFDEDAEFAEGAVLNATQPKGRRTNLGGAIAMAVNSLPDPPLAVIALTDGGANEAADNARGLAALVANRVPFIGLGVGGDTGSQTLSLQQVDAPAEVATNTLFRVSAQLEVTSGDELPAFDLELMRDGKVMQKKTVHPGRGSRFLLESFPVSEAAEGRHHYTVQFLPPAVPGLKCASTTAAVSVAVSSEKELRVLYVQGALAWDYKFVNLALQGDPGIKLTGLTRTSKHSVFRQNIETAGELYQGFPEVLEKLAEFRVVVLANVTPADLSPAQQELLARFCGELGGGILIVGGPASFNSSWQGSRLEELLPVTFAANPGVTGLDRPFRLRLTGEALQHPLFQISNDGAAGDAWSRIPAFAHYGRVNAAKPGAQIWLEHPADVGPHGPRILMASQRFGAGLSAVLCVQNFWRWRLSNDCATESFDRFWRQLFRFLSEPNRHAVEIRLADQMLQPQMEVRISLERKPKATDLPGTRQRFAVAVENQDKLPLIDQEVELTPGQPLDLGFHAPQAGLYIVTVYDPGRVPVATRTIDIRDTHLEFLHPARSMETLRQWAALTGGLALEIEKCGNARTLVASIQTKVGQVRRMQPLRRPAAVNAWMLALVLGCLSAEWWLRKYWGSNSTGHGPEMTGPPR